MLKQHQQFFKSLIVLSDLGCLTLAWWGAYYLRFLSPLFPAPEPYAFGDYLVAWVFVLAIWGGVFEWLDLYRPRRVSTHRREIVDLCKGSLLALLIFLGVVFLAREIVLSRIVVVLFWVASVVLLNLSHVGVREVLRVLRRKGFNLRHILVIGSRPQAERLVRTLEKHRQLGLQIRGVLLLDDNGESIASFGGIPLLETQEEALALLRAGAIDQVFITLSLAESNRLREIRDWIGDEPITTHFVPGLEAEVILRGRVEEFDGLPIITLQGSPLYGWNSVLKRSLDVCLGGAALVLLSPVMALIALLVKCTSPGPVFFRQERMGLDGRRFEMLKFRTMVEGAERETGPVWATADDARVTSVGRWLRRTSLDELPQLWNVLKGEMSLVGPRPPLPREVEQYEPWHYRRLEVSPGITGLWQVSGRSELSFDEMVMLDLYYIENWSLGLDLRILLRTIPAVFRGRGAY
ncbi:MAG TPA: undecaprenyl-phosphate glucose phosphotransferase [Candidatus Acidoferrales bacterium]|nr:undecaprenyl-phosphate glucose phosphotransferase [Candidatus Acidoferrales bacterium]